MRIGIISDTHIPDKAKSIPAPILEAFKGVDMIIHAGDLINLSVLKQLKTVCSKVYAVYGNMDTYDTRKDLPEKEIIIAGTHRIGVTHGCGAPGNLIDQTKKVFKDDKVDLIIFGHSHSPTNQSKDGIIFFNPGSATDKIFAPFNSYGIIEINGEIKAQIIKI